MTRAQHPRRLEKAGRKLVGKGWCGALPATTSACSSMSSHGIRNQEQQDREKKTVPVRRFVDVRHSVGFACTGIILQSYTLADRRQPPASQQVSRSLHVQGIGLLCMA